MRLLLVTSEPAWVDALRSCLSSADTVIPAELRQIVHNPAFAAACDACFVAESTTTPWTVDALKQIAEVADTPLFVLADSAHSQWEDAALFAGALQVFRKPLRGGVIQLAVARRQRGSFDPLPPRAVQVAADSRETAEVNPTLAQWRDFSLLLAEAGNPAQLIDAFVRRLRDVLRSSRVLLHVLEPASPDRALGCAFACGVERRDFEAFRLTLRSGLGQLAAERGVVVWRQRLRSESSREVAAAREMMVFGADMAVPVVGRDGVVGLLLLGPRISGADYADHEATLLYQALEGLAPVVSQLVTGTAEKAGAGPEESLLLQAMPIAAAIVSSTLRVVDVNAAFRFVLGRTGACAVTFEDLPSAWAGLVAAAVQDGSESTKSETEHRTLGAPRQLRLGVRRLGGANQAAPQFLLTVEEAASAAALALEADAHSMQSLLQRAGEQLSNEFRNALTPVDIMVQLSRESTTTRADLERLGTQVGTAIHRLRRRIDDLAYLTKAAIIPEQTTVSEVLRFTRERLDDWLEARHLKRVVWLNEFSETRLMADGRALALAMAELVMNAVEACDRRQVTVTAEDGAEVVSFRVRNSGMWAPPPETSGFRHRPFVSSKSMGVGLGVEVASRVAENHGGRLVLGPVGPDTIEAILRIPRNLVPTSRVETRVDQVL